MGSEIERDAVISTCGLYRYHLSRLWDETLPRVAFIMLNPSTADALIDDATIRKCVGFAKKWGCGSLCVVNLFAYRATKPRDMMKVRDPVGPENDEYIVKICDDAAQSGGQLICAWGANGSYKNRAHDVYRLIVKEVNVAPMALRLT